MLPSAFLSIAAVLLPIVNAATVFMDKSCTSRPDWDDYWNEAITMAELTVQKLDSNTDVDFARIFRKLMKIDKGDNSRPHGYDFIRAKFEAVTTLIDITPNEGDLEEDFWDAMTRADFRLFCDNAEVVKPQPSLRDLELNNPGRWYAMYHPEKWRRSYHVDFKNALKNEGLGCTDGALAFTSGPGQIITLSQAWPDRGQGSNPNRRVVTICNDLFKGEPLKLLNTGWEDPSWDFMAAQYPISKFVEMPSKVILHELFHCLSDDITDVGPNPYGWQNAIGKTQDDARRNADNYAILGLWALMADLGRGYTMERVDPNDDASQFRESNGLLTFYNDISRRAALLKRYVGKSFRA